MKRESDANVNYFLKAVVWMTSSETPSTNPTKGEQEEEEVRSFFLNVYQNPKARETVWVSLLNRLLEPVAAAKSSGEKVNELKQLVASGEWSKVAMTLGALERRGLSSSNPTVQNAKEKLAEARNDVDIKAAVAWF